MFFKSRNFLIHKTTLLFRKMYRAIIIYIIFFSFVNLVKCYPTNCSDEEVELFLNSDELNSLFSYYANISRQPIFLNRTVNENMVDFSLDSSDILPLNKSSYLPRRPPYICHRQARVIFHVTILSLDTLNESDMTYNLNLWLTIAWIDDRLRFPETSRDYQLLDTKWLDAMWKPVVVFKNAKEITFHTESEPNHCLVLLRNKAVVYTAKYGLLLSCPMNFETYPHDLQICDLKMESMIHSDVELLFQWDGQHNVTFHSKDEMVDTPQFSALKYTVSKCSEPYPTGNYSCLKIAFFLQRRLGYHFIHSYIPSGCIVIISWLTFWIKPDAVAARFALGLTSLLTLATLNMQSQAALPPVSYSKAIDKWMLWCSCFVFCSLIEYAAVNYLFGRFSRNLESDDATTKSQTESSRWVKHLSNRDILNMAHNMDRVSRGFFPLCFIILNIWYWTKYLSIHEDKLAEL